MHGTTVIIDDTTEYGSQDNGLAEVAVREVKGVGRSVRVALLSELPVLPWLVSCAAGQISQEDRGRWVDTSSEVARDSFP